MSDFDKIWDDQASFNAKFRPHPVTFEAKCEQTRDLVLELTDELHELLRTTVWKKHRNDVKRHPHNMAHTAEELVDAFKYFVSLCQVWGLEPADLVDGYWRKSAVCEQRYVEEWVSALAQNQPLARVAFVDLDNVLFDYILGFGSFLASKLSVRDSEHWPAVERLVLNRQWLSSESTGIPFQQWEALKHEFRTKGHKAALPLMPHAREFLSGLRNAGYAIIVVTSRPIDRYPNLMTDTIQALRRHDLPFDHVWHGTSKKTAIVERMGAIPAGAFAIDDDEQYIEEYAKAGIPVFHVLNDGKDAVAYERGGLITRVSSLANALNELSILA